MNIGKTIKKLRHNREMTQEQLAEYLGVTSQAVSRWETGTAMPDIAQLPTLANIFDVTTDTLFGVDIAVKEARVQAIIDDSWENYTSRGFSEEAIEILRGALLEYPNSYKLMGQLVLNLFSAQPDGELRRERDLEIIALGEKILAECTDDATRHSAIQYLCYTYPALDEPDKAEKLANTMPYSVISRESLLGSIYKGTKLYEHKQFSLLQRCFAIITGIMHMNTKLDDGSTPYSIDERIALQHKALAIADILIEDDNYGCVHGHLITAHKYLTQLYLKKGDTTAALEHLRLASHHADEFDKYDPDKKYTCLLYRGMGFGSVAYLTPDSESAQLLEWMKHERFDPIRGYAEFDDIKSILGK